jgi:hypothetical protein
MHMRHEQFTLHDNAVGQLAEKMNVPLPVPAYPGAGR